MRDAFLSGLKRSSPWLLSMGLGSLAVAGILLGLSKWWPQPKTADIANVEPANRAPDALPSKIVVLSFQAPGVRQSALETLARQGTATEQRQARYLLAADAVRQGKGSDAQQWLDGLEGRYAVLEPNILALRAQALALNRKENQAQTIWKQIIDKFPQSAAAGEAYFALAKTDPRYGARAIATLPAHPKTVETVVQRLKQTPNDRALLLHVARYGLHLDNYQTYLDRLTQKFGPQLKPEEWQTVGFGYWEKLKYKASGLAYSRAPVTSRNAYRAARGLQLGNENKQAIAAYNRMIAALPDAPETPKALLRLADLTDDDAKAIAHLDQALQLAVKLNRPEDAGDALYRKVKRLKTFNPAQKDSVETQLFDQFGQTEAAADLRWQKAWTAAKEKQLGTARQWALTLAQANPNSIQTPRALFWAGRWADRLGQAPARQQDFSQLVQRHPESYYTWRALSLTGQPVGDFQTVRSQTAPLNPPTQRLALATGSPLLQELYMLGEGQAAWQAWLLEFKTRERPSLPEQLTDGLIRLEAGEYIDGLFMLENLRDRLLSEPEQQVHRPMVESLHKDSRYWQALYPTPYWSDIQKWSQAHTLNPVLVVALMRQESRFQPAIESIAGAKGLMQLMPETAASVASDLKLKTYNLEQPSDNIRLGTWYLDSTHDTYGDNSMLAIASYNAGPGNVANWLKTLDTQDSDVFVESIPFDETQTYVKAVLENYWNYLRLYNPELSQRPLAKESNPSSLLTKR